MKMVSILRRLTRSLAAAIALCASLTGVVQVASVTIVNSLPQFDISQLTAAKPLWQYAVNISPSEHSTRIPPCLNNPTPPRCYSPQQMRKAYGVDELLNNGTTGEGQTIVIIDVTSSPTIESDLHLYDQLYGLEDPTLNVIAPFGTTPFNPGLYGETALDVETAHSLAPDATIDLLLTGDVSLDQTPQSFFYDLLKPVKYAIDNDLGSVISISYGAGERCFDKAFLQAEHDIFKAARDKHISILVSSGDSGAANFSCTDPTTTTGFFLGKGTSIPASDPLATSVGGTTLDASVDEGQYKSETVWNEDRTIGGAGGGGFSSVFTRPSYQDGITGIGDQRGIPDVAWDADPLTGVPIVISVDGGTHIVPFGGTSVGAPAWAAFIALFDQHANKSLGFLNDGFYRILQSQSYSDAFHDITTGNNSVTGFDVHGNPIPITGYDAGSGWDAVTGVGTPKVTNLAPLLAHYVDDDDGSKL